VLEDHSLSITTAHLFITDPDNTPSQMTVSIGTGSNYSVSGGSTITPSLNFYGILTVPVTINDGIATSNPFGVSVTVTPVNDKPVITKMPDHSIERDSAFAVINLDNLAEDVETVDSLLTWSLTGYKSLNIAIDNRKVTLTAPNANWTGSDTIIFTVTDNDATTPQSAKDTVVFTITEITGLIDQESLKAIVYPVPTDGMVTILFDKPGERDVVLEVISVQGKVVYNERQKISNDRVYLNLQKLYSGTYFIRMQIDKAVRIFTIVRK
jgi:hypothetical protein